MSDLELVKSEGGVVAPRSGSGLDLREAWEAVKSGEMSAERLAVMKDLLDLHARQQFAQAKNALQAESPRIKAMRAVPNNDGSVRYKFAPFEDIMAQVQPLLQRFGFTVSFSTRYEEARLVKICTLQHVGGHKESNEFAVRVGKGPPGASDSQADGAAGTYAKRFALCDALNIVIEKDSDAQAVGTPITKEQAFELERMCKEKNRDVAAFLKFAGAVAFSGIMSSRFEECRLMLIKARAL